jgi:glycosyltransferase involved in cell wall biosynthesis
MRFVPLEEPAIRLLMLNYEFPPFGGGTGRACAGLLEELRKRPNVEIDLVTSGPEETVERPAARADLAIHRLAIAKRSPDYWTAAELARWTLRAFWRSRRLLGERRYSLIHCWGGWPAGMVGWALPGQLPMLISLRGSDVPGYSERTGRLDPLVFRPLVRRVWRRANKLLAVSQTLRALALRTWPEAEIEVLPNGIDAARFRPQLGAVGRRLVFVGRLIPRKGVAHLITAVGRLAPRFPDVKLTIIGDGPARAELEAQAAANPAADRIRFAGRLERDALDRQLEAADLFVLPSLQEAMSNAVLEAMAASLAVVTTATGVAELIDGNGAVVPAAETDALVEALARYCTDPKRLLAHRRRSRDLSLDMSWQRLAGRYHAIYAEMLARRPAVSPRPPPRIEQCDTFPSVPAATDRPASQ